jgi:iron complex transport system substrate-binding protein
VPEQIRRAGGWELLGSDGDRSRATTWDAVFEVDPEMLLLMPCGFHLAETQAEWARAPRPDGYESLAAVRSGQVFALDGSSYFSRPGPRVIDGIELLAEIFDPGGFRDLAPFRSWAPVEP